MMHDEKLLNGTFRYNMRYVEYFSEIIRVSVVKFYFLILDCNNVCFSLFILIALI